MSGARIAVATAVTDRWESGLVAGLDAQPGVRVVRRCADLPELVACAAAGVATVVVVSANLRGLDAGTVERLRHHGCGVVALVDPDDGPGGRGPLLLDLGADQVLDAPAPPVEVAAAIRAADACRAAIPGERTGAPAALADPRLALSVEQPAHRPRPSGRADAAAAPAGAVRSGRVVAVWGPVGSPGRTTVAVGLAAELAGCGHEVLLVDADTYGASVAQSLGLLDEAAGVVAACRAADRGTLDVAELARQAPYVAARLRVLTGLVRADRWPELRAGALTTVLHQARHLAEWVVLDTGFCLEQDEELSYDTVAPRRNQATLTALEQADVVLAVGSADPVGLQRLVRGLRDLDELGVACDVVVANRLRARAVGNRPAARVRDALHRFAGVTDLVLVPDDSESVDDALLAGRTLAEHARASPVRAALQDLVSQVTALPGAAATAPVPAAAH